MGVRAHLRFRPSYAFDATIVADPTLERLRLGARAALTTAAATVLLVWLGRLFHQPPTVALVGVVVGMMATITVQDRELAEQRRTAVLLALPAMSAVVLAGLVPVRGPLGPVVFLAVVFAAVWVRRFGPRATALGMIGFLAYFDTRFFGASPPQLPWMIGSVAVGCAIAFLSRFVLLRDRPARIVRHAVRAYRRAVAILLADVADAVLEGAPDRAIARVRRSLRRVNERAIELEERIEPTDRRPLEVELAAERAVAATRRDLPSTCRSAERATRVAWALIATRIALRSGRTHEDFRLAIQSIESDVEDLPGALRDLVDAALWESPPRPRAPEPTPPTPEPALAPAPDDEPAPREMTLTTRQAVQATVACALAIVIGEWLSPSRWYWAVIAAFVVFTRATTRGETIVRAWDRVLGTVLGVVVGLVVARVVHGHTDLELGLVFAFVFLGMYLMRVSYAWLVLSITVLVAVLYDLLGRFSPGLLYLRIEETFAGAAIGSLVAIFVFPSRTMEKVRVAIAALLGESDAFLGRIAEMRSSDDELATRLRALDAKLRDVRSAAAPLVEGVVEVDPALARLVRSLASLVFACRRLATSDAGTRAERLWRTRVDEVLADVHEGMEALGTSRARRALRRRTLETASR